ncbi:AraC-like DNA-binding protein [Rhodococcus fascians]|uniref:AraC family transcriptional regulator n=1 Tax=Nocardiaceae TaxID=85025 RepID=UPI00278B1BB7|nr:MULTISPECIES: AraC family transcriptional regulator [Rhodococcus]MDQ0281302.1 AraC-like DNA-binding protein [Rhodococcus fascians]MDR6909305.1 AraC-like DNA-binding protein [Rhodococcus sp. 3258]MDR6929878.1 AraC-like DNA-binding protein [Rhodococcus fascians]
MDLMSDLLRISHARCVLSGGISGSGAWAVRSPAPGRIKILGVIRGSLWFRLDSEPADLRVDAGEVLVVDGRTSFDMGSDLHESPVQLRENDPVHPIDRDADHVCVTAHIELFDAADDFLRDAIPPVLHLHGRAREATTAAWVLEELFDEFAHERAGRTAASSQLTQLLLVQVLRAWVAAADELPSGWVRAAADDRLRPALQLMHADVGRDWHISELAAACAMSRSSFAHRFTTTAGVPPLTYLFRWRMRLAERSLDDGSSSVTELATQLGYRSESAFSVAFKRWSGLAPSRFRQRDPRSDLS